ncbi:MAG: ABC transporter permease [Candidatus Eisenbacteria bacterium]|nr:ABC transporter permease [Candidatus Eisenbacteria bacterium]
MRRIAQVIDKEFRQVLRDKPMLAIIFIVPIVQLFILGFAITTEVKHVKLLVVDLDRSSVSREIVREFAHTDRFDLVSYASDLREIRQKMRAWQVQMALVIPPRFAGQLQRNLKPELQVVVDGVDGNTAGVSLGYARGILAEFGATYAKEHIGAGQSMRVRPVTAEERMWYNPDLSTQQFMIPGIVVVLLTILPMMLSAMSLVKEKEIGTLEQLMVTPLKRHELLAGKLIPFLLLSYVELGIVMTVAILFFKIPMNGSYVLLALLAFLYLFTTLGLGIFISTVGRSQQQAMFIAWFFMVFMIMLGGFFIPIENMPSAVQKLTYINPMRYFIYIIRDIFQKGSSLRFLVRDVIPMGVFGLLIFTFSVVKFQKRVK